MNFKTVANNLISWILGVLFILIGTINLFWGNDPFFGVLIILMSLVYLPPTISIIKKKIGYSLPLFIKFIVGIFILWSAIGVGELFDKIDMMKKDIF